MKNIILLTLNTFKVTFRKKSNIIVYLILPVAGILLMMSILGGEGSGTIKVGIVNKDKSAISENMTKYLENTGRFKNVPIEEDKITEMVVDRKIDLALVIPEDFERSIYDGSFKSIKIVSLKGQEVTGWIENYTNMYIKNLLDISKASEGNKETFNKIYSEYEKGQVALKVEKLKDKSFSKGVTQQGFGFFIMFMLIGASITSNIILKEKRERVYQRICSTPVSPKIYLIGNIIANLTIITAQIILALFAVRKIFKIETYIPDLELFLVMFILGIVAVGIGMVIVALSKSSTEAGNLSTLIVTPTCMLGGCFWPLNFMPEGLQKVSNFIPQKWAIDAIAKLQNGLSLWDIRMNIFIMLGFALVFFALAAFKMKNTDKTGSFV